MPYAYANLNDLKNGGMLNITGSTYDAALLSCLEDSSEEIDIFCKRQIQPFEGTLYEEGTGSTLMLGHFDVLSLSAFNLDLNGDRTYETSLSTTDYWLYPLNGYPKTYVKTDINGSVSSFSSGIRGANVQMIGVFGFGNGQSATPYYDSGITGTVGTTTGTSLTLSAEGALQPGQTIRVDSEQMYISAVSVDGTKIATVTRGANGTTAATHSTKAIYIYQYPGVVRRACIIQAARTWKRRESAYQTRVENSITGSVDVYVGMDDDVKNLLFKGKMVKNPGF